MWKPDKPIVDFGRTLTDREAWWHEFKAEYCEVCRGAVDHEWLAAFAVYLYPFCGERDPREVAELAMLILSFDLPGFERT